MNHITFIKTLPNGLFQLGFSPVLNPLVADFDNQDYFGNKLNAIDGALRRAKGVGAKNCLVMDLSSLEILYTCRLRNRSLIERINHA